MLPEWNSVPSPRFWKRCGRSVNGARPIHSAPSPPIWVMATALRPISAAIVWQPIPPPATEPSGTSVERLCGHPEQKYGARAGSSAAGPRPAAGGRSSRAMRSRARGTGAAVERVAETGGEDGRDPVGRELAVGGDERAPLLVVLADDPRAHVEVVERVAELAARRTSASPRRRRSRRDPRANVRTISGSSGHVTPSRSSRTPRRASPASRSSTPSSRRAWTTSWYVLPAATMPMRGW